MLLAPAFLFLPRDIIKRHAMRIYRFCCNSAVMAALSSPKRSPSRWLVVMVLVTHRLMQPLSRPESALEVKSSTHALKQLSTMLPNIWASV